MLCFFLMAASAKIIDLRKLLTERFPHVAVTTPTRLFTGLSFLDEQIGGGLPKGAITELISPQISAGSASLIHALLRTHLAGETLACLTDSPRDESVSPRRPDKMSVLQPIALVDGRDSFDPCSLGNSSLLQLLWVRCTKAVEAIKAADLLL